MGKKLKTGRGAVFYLGKGFISLWSVLNQFSHQHLTVSSSSCEHLFWIDLFLLNQEKIQPLLLLSFLGHFPSAGKSEEVSAVLFFMHWTEIALDNLPVILWESATEKRELQVRNDPLNASSTVKYRNSFLIWLFPVRLCELSFIRQ